MISKPRNCVRSHNTTNLGTYLEVFGKCITVMAPDNAQHWWMQALVDSV